jgi:hypothetical protein
MTAGEHHEADVAISASASADELRFETNPASRTRFPGRGEGEYEQTTRRRNVDSPVEARRTYRRVFAATRIASRLIEAEWLRRSRGVSAARGRARRS